MRGKIRRLGEDETYQEFIESIKDILDHPVIMGMKEYLHHCDTSCFEHCMHVSYYNYRMCKSLDLDAVSAARAGMLHDLFLYDWHTHSQETGEHFHAMTHPKRALENAEKYFTLNDIERDIILKHMWPVTVSLPKYAETYVITLTDKYCGTCEIADYYSAKVLSMIPRIPHPAFIKNLLAR